MKGSPLRLILLAAVAAAALAASLASASTSAAPSVQTKVRNGPLTFFPDPGNGVARIVTFVGGKKTTLWKCPQEVFCGQPVSLAWAPDGRRVAFTLDEIGGRSTYVGFHVVNVVSGQDTRVPEGAPQTSDDRAARDAYLQKMMDRVGCWPASDLTWSADGSRLAYNCMPLTNPGTRPGRSRINTLELRGSGHATVPTGSDAFWPSWSPSATRIAYSTRLEPSQKSRVYTVAPDGSNRRLVARGAAAPAWSPDGQTIAYQTRCGIGLVTPSGRDVTPGAAANACGAMGHSGPPAWSPDGAKLAFETESGVYAMARSGRGLHLLGYQAPATTWYGSLPGRPSWRPDPLHRQLRTSPAGLIFPRTREPALAVLDAKGRSHDIWRCPRTWVCDLPGLALSPDGKRLALSLGEIAGLSTNSGMHMVDLETGAVRRIPDLPLHGATNSERLRSLTLRQLRTFGCTSPGNLAWSPNGSVLAYSCLDSRARSPLRWQRRIYTIQPDGTGRRPVPTPHLNALSATWSPDGRRIAFSTCAYPVIPRQAPFGRCSSSVYVVDLDGRGAHRLAAGVLPDWSPDGKTIAYAGPGCQGAASSSWRIRLVTPGGRDATPTGGGCVGIGPPGSVVPAWSPEGGRIAVATRKALYVMNADGSRLERLLRGNFLGRGSGGAQRPLWQP